ncbi:MAG: zinc metalloprotease HtpX [Pseudomonadales bacterium]|nr:zinc metalloprotease HtpX [Pseudomonadales bacterium]
MAIKRNTLRQISLKNQIETILLLILMGGFSWLLGAWLFGDSFAYIALMAGVMVLALNPAVSTNMLMRAYRASPLNYHRAPELNQIAQIISQRAKLNHTPELYYVPVSTMNAFATGTQAKAAIGLSHGLLQQLTLEEVAGVLAHEISHIRHNDMRVMAIADTLGNLTRTLSLLGQFILLVSIPMILSGVAEINLLPLALLIAAPTISAIIQLAISRRREYQADLSSAELLGSPQPLIKALRRLDQQNSYWERFYRASSDNGLLRTHPKTEDRIEQLNAVYQAANLEPEQAGYFAGYDPLNFSKTKQSPWSHSLRPRRFSRYFWF